MAARKSQSANRKVQIVDEVKQVGGVEEDRLDPKEEKVLDWILNGVVGFILIWLAFSIILVLGGLWHLWG